MMKTLVLLAAFVCMGMGAAIYQEPDDLPEPGSTKRLSLTPSQYRDVMGQDRLPFQFQKEFLLDKRNWYDLKDGSRVRRSPQQLGVTGMAYPGGAGSLRAQFDSPQWTSNNGRHSLQGNAYYQRNFNMPGPRQDWGAGARYTFRF